MARSGKGWSSGWLVLVLVLWLGLGVGWVRAKVGSPLHVEELELEQRSRCLRAVALCRHAQPPRGSIIVDAHVLDAARAGEARQLGSLRLGEHGLGQARVPPGCRGTWYVQWQYRCQLPCAPSTCSSTGDRMVLVGRTYSTEKRRGVRLNTGCRSTSSPPQSGSAALW